MDTAYAARHIKALALAKTCIELGARIRTIQFITGLQHNELVRLFGIDAQSAPRGRTPDSADWFLQRANLIDKLEASIFATLFMRVSALGFGPADSLIGAYQTYRAPCVHSPRITFDRAFDLVCHIKGIWVHNHQQLSLDACSHCHSHYLDVICKSGMTKRDCPFCKLMKRYPSDKRIQETFPTRAILDMTLADFGLLAVLLDDNMK